MPGNTQARPWFERARDHWSRVFRTCRQRRNDNFLRLRLGQRRSWRHHRRHFGKVSVDRLRCERYGRAELAYAPLDDGPLRINPQENESTLYFYAREVIAHAWIFPGAVHRPHRGVPPQAFARIAQSGTFTAQEGVHPLGNAAVVGAARQRRIPAKNLSHLVEIAQCNRTARRLLDERAELLGRIIQLAIDVVDPKTVVFAGDAFTADPAGVQLIAKQLRQDSHGLSDLRIQRAGKSIVQDAARVVATYQLWQDPIGTLS